MDIPLSFTESEMLAELLEAVTEYAAAYQWGHRGHRVRILNEASVLTKLKWWVERHSPEPAQLAGVIQRLRM